MIEAYDTACVGFASQPSPDRSTVVRPDCVGILLKQNNFATMALPLHEIFASLRGVGMGPWLVLVSPCFRENVVAICKIGSLLCSLDNLLQKIIIIPFFGNQISKWRSFEKGLFLTYFSHFLVTRGKLQKSLQHISHSHTYTYFAHLTDFFCLTNFEKNTNLSDTGSLWYES